MLQASISRYDRLKKEVEDFNIDPIAASQQLQLQASGESAKPGAPGAEDAWGVSAAETSWGQGSGGGGRYSVYKLYWYESKILTQLEEVAVSQLWARSRNATRRRASAIWARLLESRRRAGAR